MRLLTVCGSLRSRSSNAAVLDAFRRVLPATVATEAFAGLGDLPHFNPDLDAEPLPAPVVLWRRAVEHADALVISTPEYAHALPGSFKNALDWLVSGTEAMSKPVAILHVARGTTWALDSLREVLMTMSARIVDAACVSLPLGSNQADVETILACPELRLALLSSAESLAEALGQPLGKR